MRLILQNQVIGLVEAGVSWGVDGVVCSALEVPEIRSRYPGLYLVVPGIRPTGVASNDQARVTTPARARELGIDAVVIGRPITESKNPREMAESILRDLSPTSKSSAS